MGPVLLSTAYFPPVSYFAAIASGMGGLVFHAQRRLGEYPPIVPSEVYVEACENFQKQSYRNRCRFYAADGVQVLSVPVVHEGGRKIPVSEVRIDWSKPWLKQHERAIVSAYRTSAYFEYYQDELFAILESRHQTLFELNSALLEFFCAKFALSVNLHFTEEYSQDALVSNGALGCIDLREAIHPKREDTLLHELGLEKPYFQVFSPKYGFKSNLSAMDLLFNEGPDSINFLYGNLNGRDAL